MDSRSVAMKRLDRIHNNGSKAGRAWYRLTLCMAFLSLIACSFGITQLDMEALVIGGVGVVASIVLFFAGLAAIGAVESFLAERVVNTYLSSDM